MLTECNLFVEDRLSDNTTRTFIVIALFFVGGMATLLAAANETMLDLYNRLYQASRR
jgi:hypothetical protein